MELEGQPFVVYTELVENRGVYIPHVDRVFDDIVAEIIGFPVDNAALYTAASHPAGKAFRVMVAPVIIRCERALAVDSASKFAAPND